jgi:hypothetical protein
MIETHHPPVMASPDAILIKACSTVPAMKDDQDRATAKTGADVKDSRHNRLKLALRENLKRRKSQARGRNDVGASSETDDASLNDASGEKPSQ